mgnify:CR=1 FL=1
MKSNQVPAGRARGFILAGNTLPRQGKTWNPKNERAASLIPSGERELRLKENKVLNYLTFGLLIIQ